eukprot:ANDGO_02037.mRNA.1 hypothetical protein
MSLFTCRCLNLSIQLSSYASVELADTPFPGRTVSGPLHLMGFKAAHCDLLSVFFTPEFRVFHCLHCRTTLCCTLKEDNTYYVDGSLRISRDSLHELSASPVYSSVFHILMNACDPALQGALNCRQLEDKTVQIALQKQLDEALEKEKSYMVARIKAFEQMEKAKYLVLEQKCVKERDSLYNEICRLKSEKTSLSPSKKGASGGGAVDLNEFLETTRRQSLEVCGVEGLHPALVSLRLKHNDAESARLLTGSGQQDSSATASQHGANIARSIGSTSSSLSKPSSLPKHGDFGTSTRGSGLLTETLLSTSQTNSSSTAFIHQQQFHPQHHSQPPLQVKPAYYQSSAPPTATVPYSVEMSTSQKDKMVKAEKQELQTVSSHNSLPNSKNQQRLSSKEGPTPEPAVVPKPLFEAAAAVAALGAGALPSTQESAGLRKMAKSQRVMLDSLDLDNCDEDGLLGKLGTQQPHHGTMDLSALDSSESELQSVPKTHVSQRLDEAAASSSPGSAQKARRKLDMSNASDAEQEQPSKPETVSVAAQDVSARTTGPPIPRLAPLRIVRKKQGPAGRTDNVARTYAPPAMWQVDGVSNNDDSTSDDDDDDDAPRSKTTEDASVDAGDWDVSDMSQNPGLSIYATSMPIQIPSALMAGRRPY